MNGRTDHIRFGDAHAHRDAIDGIICLQRLQYAVALSERDREGDLADHCGPVRVGMWAFAVAAGLCQLQMPAVVAWFGHRSRAWRVR